MKWKNQVEDYKKLAEKMGDECLKNDQKAGVTEEVSKATGFIASASLSLDDPIKFNVDVSQKLKGKN